MTDVTTKAGFARKPPLIVVFSLFYMLNPLGNFVMLVLNSPLSATQVPSYLYFSTVLRPNPIVIATLLLWISAPILAVGLYRVRLWAWYGFIGHSVLSLLSSVYQASSGEFGFTMAFWINCLTLLPLGYFIRKEIRKPYFNPQLRWWEQHPRLRDSIGVTLRWNEYVFHEKTFDLSPDGIFVQTDHLDDAAVGYFFNVRLEFSGERNLEIQGIVVWMNFEDRVLPRGYGIKFLGISQANRKFIARYIKRGFKAGKLSTERADRDPDA